ncbi:HlyD family secretion protein [Edaphobacter modestus]|uniref:HlyD family secretion protein n=1 Tax=Edaphobacter modestus TaxID=388466 RepID=UPI0013EEA67E|nr:HlyD family secretion protein [Edaphobacter modestus]
MWKHWRLLLVLSLVCVGCVVATFLFFSGRVSTDDAQVDSHISSVSSRISGHIDQIQVDDNQQVAAGELLARIDPRDYQAEVDQATAALEMAIAQERSANVTVRLTGDTVRTGIESAVAAESASESELVRSQKSFEQTATATLNAAQAAMEAKRAVNVRAQADLARYQPLLVSADVSKMQFDAVQASAQVAASEFALAQEKLAEAQKAVDIARAQTDAAVAQVIKSKAIVRQSEALRQQIGERDAQHRSSVAAVEHAKAQLDLAKLQLSYSEIRAPISGVVTQRSVQLGDQVAPGQLLLTIVPLDQIYVTANFKETQLAHMHSGQRAVIRADMYGDLRFEGTVNSISGAAGSRQALLPPQNATGNFVKVVQRIPVKILVTRSSRTDALLRPGTNVKATVYVH